MESKNVDEWRRSYLQHQYVVDVRDNQELTNLSNESVEVIKLMKTPDQSVLSRE